MRLSILRGIVLLILVLAPVGWAQASGECHTTMVPGPIVLPDNSIEDAGKLEVCLSRMYSPVAGFHRMSVNGRVAGMFRSHVDGSAAAEAGSRPYFVFAHRADGTYQLESYAWSDGQSQVIFEMRPVRVRSRWKVSRSAAERSGGVSVVRLASIAAVR